MNKIESIEKITKKRERESESKLESERKRVWEKRKKYMLFFK